MTDSYEEDFADQAYRLCLMGAHERGIADFFGITYDAFIAWKKRHPTFARALKLGKTAADADVAFALHQRACGYKWKEQVAVKCKTPDGGEELQVVEVEKQVPPDTNACIHWLTVRQGWPTRNQVATLQLDEAQTDFVIKLVKSGEPLMQTIEHEDAPVPVFRNGNGHDA